MSDLDVEEWLTCSRGELVDMLKRLWRENEVAHRSQNNAWLRYEVQGEESKRQIAELQQRIAELEAEDEISHALLMDAEKRIAELKNDNKDKSQLLSSFQQQIAELELIVQNYRLASNLSGAEIQRIIDENKRLDAALDMAIEALKSLKKLEKVEKAREGK